MKETGAALLPHTRPHVGQRLLMTAAIAVLLPPGALAWGLPLLNSAGTQRVDEEIPVHDAGGAPAGKLQILEDTRLTPKLQKEMWGIGGWSFVLDEDDGLYKEFKIHPPMNAELRLLGRDGRVVSSKELEAPLARMEARNLGKETEFFLVTVDLSVGFGSYAGLTTYPFAVNRAEFEWAEILDPATHQPKPVVLSRTLKTDWKLVTANGVADFYELACRPNFPMRNDSDFVLQLIHFRYDGKNWTRAERQEAGFWESANSFPLVDAFPPIPASP